MKNTGLAAAVAALALSSTPALAQKEPVKVGIIDARADRLVTPSSNVEVNYREFVTGNGVSGRMKASVGWDHGVLVATAVARQIKDLSEDRAIKIYAANAFFLNGADENDNPKLGIDFEGAKQAIAWFRSEGVKVVVTSFVGRDSESFRDFMKTANDAGLIIVAPIANVVTEEMQYPAAYPEAISVAAFNNGMPVRKDAKVAQWVEFATDGSLPIRELNGKSDYGSSFASARVAGILASIDAEMPIVDANDARDRLKEFAQGKSYSLEGTRIDLPYIQISSMPGKFQDYVARTNDEASLMVQFMSMKKGMGR